MAPSRQTLSYADESPAVDSAAEATSAAQQRQWRSELPNP
jgi:hypothetical protein